MSAELAQDPFFQGDATDVQRAAIRPATRRQLALVFLLTMACALPFLGKAVQQDDWAYLAVSELIEEHGLFGMLDQTTLYQGRPEQASHGMLHGPVWPGLLFLCHKTGSFVLWAGHLISALFLGLLAVSGAALAARLGARPVPSGLALALSPIPLVLAGGLMTDLPMVALFTAALALVVRALQEDHLPSYLAAGAVGACAELTRYHGLAILPMFAVAPLLLGRVKLRAWLPLLICVLAYAAWTLASMVARGEADHDRAVGVLNEVDLDTKECLLAAVCAVGGVALGWWLALATAPLALLKAWLSDPLALSLSLAGAAFGVYCGFDALASRTIDPAGVNLSLQWVFLVLGGIALFAFLAPLLDVARLRQGFGAWRDARGLDTLLALWFLGFFVSAWLTVPFGAARYCLPAMPPLFLGLARFSALCMPARVPRIAWPLSAALGLACAITDLRAADVYRQVAAEVGQRMQEGVEGWDQGQTWIWGELGFRWYLEHELDLPLIPSYSNEPAPGDRLLKSALCTAAANDGRSGTYTLQAALVQRMHNQEVREYPDAWPVRIHNAYAAAGFYNADAGILPFSWSSEPHDKVQTWVVKDENQFLANFERARQSPGAPMLVPGNAPYPARILVERLSPRADVEDKLCVYFVLEGALVWDGVPLPDAPSSLYLEVAEHRRSHEQVEVNPGPGAVAQVLINGEVVSEQSMDARRAEADRRWFPLEVDLERWQGQRVSVGLRVRAQEAPAGMQAGFERCILVGFAEPRIVAR